jgi:hypothetical protein
MFNSIPNCFLWLPNLLHFSIGAGVGSTFEVFVFANIPLPILGN